MRQHTALTLTDYITDKGTSQRYTVQIIIITRSLFSLEKESTTKTYTGSSEIRAHKATPLKNNSQTTMCCGHTMLTARSH